MDDISHMARICGMAINESDTIQIVDGATWDKMSARKRREMFQKSSIAVIRSTSEKLNNDGHSDDKVFGIADPFAEGEPMMNAGLVISWTCLLCGNVLV